MNDCSEGDEAAYGCDGAATAVTRDQIRSAQQTGLETLQRKEGGLATDSGSKSKSNIQLKHLLEAEI